MRSLETINIEVVVNDHATIGESPTWSPAEGALYWIDVKAPALHRLDQEGRSRTWQLESDVGAFALTDGPPGAVVAQGPLPIETVTIMTGSKKLWGAALHEEMLRYNHLVGLKMVGEQLPDERNQVTLADETDQYGLRIPRITYSWGDNDKALIEHALGQMTTSLDLVGAKDIFQQKNDMNHLGGTAAWDLMPTPAWWTATVGPGTSRTCGSATVPCSPPWAA